MALLIILVLGSIYIQWNFYLRSINRLPLLNVTFDREKLMVFNRDKQIALTFDDGPAEYTAVILDILKQEHVPATFFIIGKNIGGKENLLQRAYAEGHRIGNHSFHHGFNFDWQSAAKMLQEIKQTNHAIEAITGMPVTLFRPPYGVTNPNLRKALQTSGLKSIGWSLRSMDTVAKKKTKLLQKILQKIKAGDILLLHDRCSVTAAILPELITGLKKRGFTFVTL